MNEECSKHNRVFLSRTLSQLKHGMSVRGHCHMETSPIECWVNIQGNEVLRQGNEVLDDSSDTL